MQKIPYASAKESLIYVHVFMCLYIMYITKVLERYFCNLGLHLLKTVKYVIWYLHIRG